MLTIQVTGDTEIIAKMGALPDKIRQALYSKVASLASDLETYIIDEKLSGQVLNHRTGALWNSIHNYAGQDSTSVYGQVKSEGVTYAAIHEYGKVFNRDVYEAWGHPLKAPLTVTFRYPERSFMRSALEDKKQDIIDGMNEAVMRAVKS